MILEASTKDMRGIVNERTLRIIQKSLRQDTTLTLRGKTEEKLGK